MIQDMQGMQMLISLHSSIMDSLKLTLAGQTVEDVYYPGQATSILGLASYSTDYTKGCGLAQGWYPDTNINAVAGNTAFNVRQGYLIQRLYPKGSFQCVIPMRHIRICG